MAVISKPASPRKGEIIFRADPTRREANAVVGRLHPAGSIDPPLSEGYRMGARVLAEHASAQNAYHQSYLIWPIVFNYRHHVELVLKRMLCELSQFSEEPLDDKSRTDLSKHHLGALWEDFKALLQRPEVAGQCSSIEMGTDDIEGVDDYLRQLSEVDPGSMSFRYPRGNKGQPLLPGGLTHINVAVFSEHMERLCDFLDGLDGYIGMLLENANEIRAESWNENQAEYDRNYY